MKKKIKKKKKIEARGNVKLPFVYCSKCRKYQIARIDNMTMKDKKDKRKKFKISIISCGVCEIVQNMERIPKMKWLTYAQVKKICPDARVYKEI